MSTLSQFISNPTRKHMISVKELYRYLYKPIKILKSSIKVSSMKNRVLKYIRMQSGPVTKSHRSQALDTSLCLQDVLFADLQNCKVALLSHPQRQNILLPPRLEKRLFGSVVFFRNFVNLTFILYFCTVTIKDRLRWQKILKIISVQSTYTYVIIKFGRNKKTVQSQSINFLKRIWL